MKSNREIGEKIYKNALHHRRGFRFDQLGIGEDDDIWTEIFEQITQEARAALQQPAPAESEAVAWQVFHEGNWINTVFPDVHGTDKQLRPLYAAPIADRADKLLAALDAGIYALEHIHTVKQFGDTITIAAEGLMREAIEQHEEKS